MPDLIIETTIRDGLAYLKANPSVVDDIFSPLLKGYAARKYGSTEIARIKALLAEKEIAVAHSFHEAAAKSPSYSIQLGNEAEAKDRAHLNDFEMDVREPLSAPELSALEKITNLIPTSYDSFSGKVSVDDSVDTSVINAGYIYKDGSGVEFEIQRGCSNIPGNKFFFILKGQDPDIVNPGLVKSSITESQYEQKGDTSRVHILIGVHTKDALLTKYLYAILKYIMKSRKADLIKRCFLNSTFQGSDFTRDLQYLGDQVFTRFFTISGEVDDTWRSDNVDLIDNVEIEATPVE